MESSTSAESSSISAESSISAGLLTVVESAAIAGSFTNSITNVGSPTNEESLTIVGSPTYVDSSTNAGPSIDASPSIEPPDFEPSGFVDVWRGKYHGNPVCIKAVRTRNKSNLQKIKKVHGPFFQSESHSPPIYQIFYQDGQECKHFSHPNILPVIEVSEGLFPFCIMTPWIPGGNIMQYTQKNPSANRLMLVIAR